MSNAPLRVAVLADMLEERWPSMDLVAEVLVRELESDADLNVSPRLVRPGLLPSIARWQRDGAPTRVRVINRFWIYPRRLPAPDVADVFHIVDHSYAHLVLDLPAERTVVTCHDLDAFLQHEQNGRGAGLPGFLVKRLALGLSRAARIACPSQATATALVEQRLARPEQIAVVLNGVDLPELSDTESEALSSALVGPQGRHVDLLHVGSTIPRKRLDVLLDVFARVASAHESVRLLRVGGPLTDGQRTQADALGLAGRIVELPSLDRRQLAAIYRRATLLLAPSEREGFGLPVAEALASSTPAVTSDLPVFREVAADAADFVPVGDVDAWAAVVSARLDEAISAGEKWRARRARARARGALYSWRRYASQMAGIYRSLSPIPAAGAAPPA